MRLVETVAQQIHKIGSELLHCLHAEDDNVGQTAKGIILYKYITIDIEVLFRYVLIVGIDNVLVNGYVLHVAQYLQLGASSGKQAL